MDAVADDGHHFVAPAAQVPATAMPSAAEMEVAAWPDAEGVVGALLALGEAGQPALLADRGEPLRACR